MVSRLSCSLASVPHKTPSEDVTGSAGFRRVVSVTLHRQLERVSDKGVYHYLLKFSLESLLLDGNRRSVAWRRMILLRTQG